MNNPNVKITARKTLSDNWYTLKKITFEYKNPSGEWETQEREAYDRGNGAAILLYNTKKQTVILTKQFRMPTYINGNPTGMMIEACAGILDQENPEECIIRETEEETGYRIENATIVLFGQNLQFAFHQTRNHLAPLLERLFLYFLRLSIGIVKSKQGKED
jgi:nudix-type nucleoside diphosphatase (YffH/AdpP family)